MNALFTYLVGTVGKKTFLDPKTKQDPVQDLIQFYT